MFFQRSTWAALPLALSALACGEDEKLGAVMLAISTDMYIDKDVDRVDVVIQPENGPMQSQPFNLFPALDGKFLPGTFSIIEGSTPGEFVRVRIIARKQNTARVVREAALRVPRKRTALLSMPIQWLCDGHVREDGQLSRSSCPDEETCLAGSCLPDEIDETTLPTYLPGDVFGGGNATGGGDCFDTMGCFEVNSAPALNLDTCVLDAEVSDDLNVAIWLPAGSDGHCSNAECWVPLDAAAITGWSAAEDGNGVQLPTAVCEHVRSGGASVRVSHECQTKTVGVPTCGQWTLVGTEPGDEEPPLDGAPLVVTNLTLADELETATRRLARTVAAACAGITGQSPPDEPSVAEVSALCEGARSRIAEFGSLDWYHITTRCWPDATRQLACERACNESCDPGNVVQRCEPAQVVGGCSDSCSSRECLGSDRRATGCAGACDGTCKGICGGNCIGQCTGNCDATGADGAYCVGYCDAMCSGLCQGRCEGTCEGTCESDPNLPVPECATGTQCRGGCAGDYTSPVCHSPLTTGPCTLSDDCAADCVSIGNLGVACEPATAWFMPRTGLDETLRQALEQALAELVTVSDVEAPAIAEQAQRIGDDLREMATGGDDSLRAAQAGARVGAAAAMLEAIGNATTAVVDAVGEPRDTPGPAIPSADCTASVGGGRDGLIDDFEDDNSQISVRDGRNGYWHIVRDSSVGAQLSPSEPPRPESNGVNSSRGAMHLSGTGFIDWGAGLSVEMRGGVLPHDASAYQGLRFWARGEPALRLVFVQQNLATGDTCTTCPQSSSECGIFYGAQVALTSDWTEFTIPWNELTQYASGSTPFAPDQLLLIKFEAPATERFEFWLDDVSFY